MSEPKEIVQAFVDVLRQNMALTELQCFMAIVPAWVEGQPEEVIQVIPGAINNDELDTGGQIGGINVKRIRVDLVYYKRLDTDAPGYTETLLAAESEGSLDRIEQIHEIFRFSMLGGVLHCEPVRYEGESGTDWVDEDTGTVKRTITFSAQYVTPWPRIATS